MVDLDERFEAETADPLDPRSEATRDRDRLVHSSSFRRLQGKSQIVGIDVADFFRTRLTHSLECAQIGRAIAVSVVGDPAASAAANDVQDLPAIVEAACLGHDLGHPPFGHNGEQALQDEMKLRNGSLFEGNAQSFRIVTLLEPKRFRLSPDRSVGLNLTRGTLRALLKYPCFETRALLREEHPKFGAYRDPLDEELFSWAWAGETPRRNLATEIMDTADEIAYAVHDFEDGVWAQMIPLHDVLNANEHVLAELEDMVVHQDEERVRRGKARLFGGNAFADTLTQLFPGEELTYWRRIPRDKSRYARAELKNFTSKLIGEFIRDVARGGVFETPVGNVARRLAVLKGMAWAWMITRSDLETHKYGQQKIIRDIFDGYWMHPGMLPQREEWGRIAEDTSLRRIPRPTSKTHVWRRRWPEKARLICDHIAGMTDGYAIRVHDQMYRGRQERDLRLAY
jgi:dGTPase